MKRSCVLAFCLALGLASLGIAQVAAPAKEHAWLTQLVGEWESKIESVPQPGVPEMKCQGSISTKMLGELWVVSQMQMDMAGIPMAALQTIGYDEKSERYVGTWVDSLQNHMWKYEGSIDPTGKILTLEADGPSMLEPGTTAKYRDIYELKSKDEYLQTSAMQGPDGKWITFMKGEVRRKRAS
jgi:hypothetical protein